MRHCSSKFGIIPAAVLSVLATMWPVQPAFGSGIARRDAVRAEEQHRQEAVKLATAAANFGTEGDGSSFLAAVESAMAHARKAGRDVHVDAGIAELKQAIEHVRAGHADLATKQIEFAITHLSEK